MTLPTSAARSEKGHVTLPKGGRAPAGEHAAPARGRPPQAEAPPGERDLWQANGHAKVTQMLLNKWMSRIQRLAELKVTGGIHILCRTF
ncbi:MAG: hypothetical protein EOO70_01945 [Myxococcaceae bacterium]|nr:MAG: hypothetical protein EOO70_01945 [Myxococcaceae bacterium]